MLLEKIKLREAENEAMMEATSRTASSTSNGASWPPSGVIKPVPERPEPIYPIRPDALSLKGNDNLRSNSDLRTIMGLPSVPQVTNMYPFLQLPLPGNTPKYLPFGPFLYHSKYPMGKKTFHCPQCRYITDRKNNLKRHIATMHQDCGKPLECCEIHFKSKAALRDHVMMFHRAGYKCRFCGRNFCRKALLKRHLAVHNGQKDFICSICDYATSHKSNLERHKKVHGQGHCSDDDDDLSPSEGTIDVEGFEPNTLNQIHPFHSSHLQMLRTHHLHHSRLLDLANSQGGTMHSSVNRLFNSQIGNRETAQDLSPGTSGSRTPDHSPRARPREITEHSRTPRSRSHSPGEQRPSTPEMSTEGATEHNDVTPLFRYSGPKRLFGSPYKCSECTLSFPSQIQLALHMRECKNMPTSQMAHMTSLPLPVTWPPYPLMLPSAQLNMQMNPLMSTLPFSGLNSSLAPNFTPFKTQRTTDDATPLKAFWPFTLQRPDVMTSLRDKDDVILPPKKRSLIGSEPSAMDFRASTLASAPH